MVNTSRTVAVMIAVAAITSSGCGGEPAGCPMGTRQLADGGCILSDAGPTPDSGPTTAPCTRASDCDDGMFCNGVERCEPGSSGADARGCVAAATPCMASQICDEDLDLCVTDCSEPDADIDGDRSLACGGGDCDDTDPAVNSLVNEVCDDHGVNEDCNWMTIHNAETNDGDRDGDRHIDVRCFNVREDGAENRGTDCDDSSPSVNAAGVEACNGVDDDCDGRVDEGLLSRYYRDDDGDLYGRDDDMLDACARPSGYTVVGGDCDDDDRMINPAGRETCDGVDQDCDGRIDEEAEELGTREHCSACGDECQFACAGTSCDLAANVEVGFQHSCVLLDSGAMYCWGENGSGELGTGLAADSYRPVLVAGSHRASAMTVGASHTCFIEGDDALWCFGENSNGQLGDDTFEDRSAPTRVLFSGRLSMVSAGGVHTCVILTSGEVYCSGDGSSYQNGSTFNTNRFNRIPGLSGVTQVTAGGTHSCARLASGVVQCWGSDAYGQLGDGTAGGRRTAPAAVAGLSGVAQVEAGQWHTCARRLGGDVSCWGRNEFGQLGKGTTGGFEAAPVAAGSITFSEISAGLWSTFGIRSDGAHYWGWGISFDQSVPTPVSGGSDFRTIAFGDHDGCGIDAAGIVWCWGHNPTGAVGDGTTSLRRMPVRVVPPLP